LLLSAEDTIVRIPLLSVGVNPSHVPIVFALKNRRDWAEIYIRATGHSQDFFWPAFELVEVFTLGRRTASGESCQIAIPVTRLAPKRVFSGRSQDRRTEYEIQAGRQGIA
jgi:hypothetical protein